MPTCDTPRCGEPGRWQVTATGRRVCAEHIPDGQAVTLAEPRPADPPTTDEGILAAVCPPGWRRSPLDGRPVMPCLGKLLFPCRPNEVPTPAECHAQCAVCLFDPIVGWLVLALLMDAIDDKTRHNHCMHLYDEGAVSAAVDAALFAQGAVRIRKTAAGGWEEVGADAAAK